MWAQTINIITGLLLMIAPDVWKFGKAAADNNHIAAPLILTFAITALWEVNRNVRLFNIPAGLWLIMAAFIFNYSSFEMIFDISCGILLVIFSLFKGSIQGKYGGGWRSLFQNNPVHAQALPKK